jgi:hypothetical protein
MNFGYFQTTPSFGGMKVVVLPDDDERMKDIPDGDIGSDGASFYCRESQWPRLKGLLLAGSSESKGSK